MSGGWHHKKKREPISFFCFFIGGDGLWWASCSRFDTISGRSTKDFSFDILMMMMMMMGQLRTKEDTRANNQKCVIQSIVNIILFCYLLDWFWFWVHWLQPKHVQHQSNPDKRQL
jgi:hypothetical protein